MPHFLPLLLPPLSVSPHSWKSIATSSLFSLSLHLSLSTSPLLSPSLPLRHFIPSLLFLSFFFYLSLSLPIYLLLSLYMYFNDSLFLKAYFSVYFFHFLNLTCFVSPLFFFIFYFLSFSLSLSIHLISSISTSIFELLHFSI